MDNDELFEKACKAYERYCTRHNYVYQYPSTSLSEVGDTYVHLRNSNGDLADYDIAKKCIVEEDG